MPSPTTIDYGSLRNKPYLDPADDGIIGDGVTDCSTSLGAWFAAKALLFPGGFDVAIRNRFYIPGGFALPSHVALHGTRSGALIGSPAYITSPVPIPTTFITLHGAYTTGAAVGYPSTITAGATLFTVANSFTAGQYVMLNNYPTDAGGTDAYTVNGDGSRNYTTGAYAGDAGRIDPANKRQFRRIEPARVRTATSSSFELYSPVAYDYSYTDQLQFAPYTPVADVLFDDVVVQDILIEGWMTDQVSWRGGKLIRSTFSSGRSIGCNATEVILDAQDTDNCVGFGRSALDFRISGNFSGGNISSDNSLIRVDQAANFSIDAIGRSHKSGLYLVLVDTNYAEDPGDSRGKAYPDVPARNGRISITDSGENMTCFLSCNQFAAPIDNMMVNVVAGGNPPTQSVYFKGVSNLIAKINTPYGSMRAEGSSGKLDGFWTGLYAPGPGNIGQLFDPRNPSVYVSNSLKTPNYSTYTG